MEEKDTVQYKAAELKDGETKESLLREADGLRMQIRHHEYQYYVLDAPEISDAEYDALTNRLRSIEALYPDEVPPDSPTRRPGGYVAPGFTQVKHMVPMCIMRRKWGILTNGFGMPFLPGPKSVMCWNRKSTGWPAA